MTKESRKNIAYNYLREAILTWKLHPGSPIVEQDISDQLSISRTPVREALKLLEAEGLVKVMPQRGTFVFELSTQDVEEIFALRENLEVLALQAAIQSIPIDELNNLEAYLTTLTEQSPPEHFFTSDRQLHALIVVNGGNERLALFLDSLNAQVEQVRRVSALRPNRLDVSMREHLAIVQAIQARDIITAEAELRQHIRNVKQSTLDVCRNMWWQGTIGK
ncbi:MAG: GntR family transcriptional regulator [Desulfitobacterium hafniense]|nr:GntR family transcriptional regulator [Desulfitobacterium hafniense]